jgi:hypothetical protein
MEINPVAQVTESCVSPTSSDIQGSKEWKRTISAKTSKTFTKLQSRKTTGYPPSYAVKALTSNKISSRVLKWLVGYRGSLVMPG